MSFVFLIITFSVKKHAMLLILCLFSVILYSFSIESDGYQKKYDVKVNCFTIKEDSYLLNITIDPDEDLGEIQSAKIKFETIGDIVETVFKNNGTQDWYGIESSNKDIMEEPFYDNSLLTDYQTKNIVFKPGRVTPLNYTEPEKEYYLLLPKEGIINNYSIDLFTILDNASKSIINEMSKNVVLRATLLLQVNGEDMISNFPIMKSENTSFSIANIDSIAVVNRIASLDIIMQFDKKPTETDKKYEFPFNGLTIWAISSFDNQVYIKVKGDDLTDPNMKYDSKKNTWTHTITDRDFIEQLSKTEGEHSIITLLFQTSDYEQYLSVDSIAQPTGINTIIIVCVCVVIAVIIIAISSWACVTSCGKKGKVMMNKMLTKQQKKSQNEELSPMGTDVHKEDSELF